MRVRRSNRLRMPFRLEGACQKPTAKKCSYRQKIRLVGFKRGEMADQAPLTPRVTSTSGATQQDEAISAPKMPQRPDTAAPVLRWITWLFASQAALLLVKYLARRFKFSLAKLSR